MKTFTKKVVMFLILLFFSIITLAQTTQWINVFGGNTTDRGYAVSTDSTGNIYSLGSFDDECSFGSHILSTKGQYDSFLTKTDSSGNIIWAKQIGGTLNDYATSIFTNTWGIFVSGTFQGSVSIDATTIASTGSEDTYLCKFDFTGNLIWAKAINVGAINSITGDLLGNIYTTGWFSGIASFGSFTNSAYGQNDAFIGKLDINGNALWFNKIGGSSFDVGSDLEIDSLNNIYLSGSFSNTAFFSSYSLTANGNSDAFIAKINPAGMILWVKQYGGSGSDGIGSISLNSTNKIYIAGGYTSPATFGAATFTSGNIFICCVDSSGSILWANHFDWNNSLHHTDLYSITSDLDGNVYSTGRFNGIVSFGSNNNPQATLTSQSFDAFVSKLDLNGNFIWAKKFGGNGVECAYSITNHFDQIYITGFFSGTATVDNLTVTSLLSSEDYFLIKISPDAVGIKEYQSVSNIKIYPNPVSNNLVIESKTIDQNIQLLIKDFLGKEILKQKSFNSKTETLDVSMLLPGVYFLQIHSDKKSGIVKIIKE